MVFGTDLDFPEAKGMSEFFHGGEHYLLVAEVVPVLCVATTLHVVLTVTAFGGLLAADSCHGLGLFQQLEKGSAVELYVLRKDFSFLAQFRSDGLLDLGFARQGDEFGKFNGEVVFQD
jgi:hypothetical protein